MELDDEYRALLSVVECSAEYRLGEPNIELFIQMLNIVLKIDLEKLNIELYIGILNIVLNIDMEMNMELYFRMLNIVLNIDLESRI